MAASALICPPASPSRRAVLGWRRRSSSCRRASPGRSMSAPSSAPGTQSHRRMAPPTVSPCRQMRRWRSPRRPASASLRWILPSIRAGHRRRDPAARGRRRASRSPVVRGCQVVGRASTAHLRLPRPRQSTARLRPPRPRRPRRPSQPRGRPQPDGQHGGRRVADATARAGAIPVGPAPATGIDLADHAMAEPDLGADGVLVDGPAAALADRPGWLASRQRRIRRAQHGASMSNARGLGWAVRRDRAITGRENTARHNLGRAVSDSGRGPKLGLRSSSCDPETYGWMSRLKPRLSWRPGRAAGKAGWSES